MLKCATLGSETSKSQIVKLLKQVSGGSTRERMQHTRTHAAHAHACSTRARMQHTRTHAAHAHACSTRCTHAAHAHACSTRANACSTRARMQHTRERMQHAQMFCGSSFGWSCMFIKAAIWSLIEARRRGVAVFVWHRTSRCQQISAGVSCAADLPCLQQSLRSLMLYWWSIYCFPDSWTLVCCCCRYEMESDTWQIKQNLLKGRCKHTMVEQRGKLIITGELLFPLIVSLRSRWS